MSTKEKDALKSAEYSYVYARDILKGRFKKGEDAIIKSACYSYRQARYVLKRRFERGEDTISKNDRNSKLYKKHIYDAEKGLKKELEDLEDLKNTIPINYLYGIEI